MRILLSITLTAILTFSHLSSVANHGHARMTPGEMIRHTIRASSFPEAEIHRLWDIESGRNDRATGKRMEVGRGQVMLSTARDYFPQVTERDLRDSVLNTIITIRHLESLKDQFKRKVPREKLRLVVYSAYNRGAGRVLADLRQKRNPINSYARRIVGGGNEKERRGGPRLR
jgi:soluble lytic murein transglycosylase-like protein